MKKLLIGFVICVFLAIVPAQVFAVKVDRATIEKYSYVCGPNGELCGPMGGPLDGPVYFEAKPRNLTVGMAMRSETVEVKGFKAKYGVGWQVRWHSDRNVPKKIFGSVYQTDVTEIRDKATAESVVKGFLVDNKALLKINPSEMKLSRVRDGWNVEYLQYYSDIPVYGSRVGATITGDGRIIGIGNNFYPDINISTTPTITKEKAVEVVLKQKDAGTTVNETGEVINGTLLYIVPKTEDGNIIYHLTWRVPTHTALYFINAEDSSIVLRVQTAFPVSVYGYSEGWIIPDKESNDPSRKDPVYVPFVNEEVDVWYSTGGGSAGSDYTNSSGYYSVPVTSNNDYEVWAFLDGEHVWVTYSSGTKVVNIYPLGYVTGDVQQNVDWGENYNSSVYYHADYAWKWFNDNFAHDQPKVHAYIPSSDVTNFDHVAVAGYDNQNGEHYIKWNEDHLDYADWSDYTYHEYAHGVMHYIYGMRQPSEKAVREGWPDYIAGAINDDSYVGGRPGDLDANWQYKDKPPAAFATALWDIRKAIGAADADRLIWNATNLQPYPDTTEEFFENLLTMDDIIFPDGNGNIDDGTPHFDEIWQAFYSHGIIMPKIQADYSSGQIAVSTRANGIGPELHWKLGFDEDISGGIRYWYDLDNNPTENLVSEGYGNGPIGLFYYGYKVSSPCSGYTYCTYWTHVPGLATDFTLLESNDVRAVIKASGIPHMYSNGASDNNVEFTVIYTVYATGKVGIELDYNWKVSEALKVGAYNNYGSEIFFSHVDGSTAWVPRSEHDSDITNGYSGTASTDSFLLWSSDSGNRLADVMLSFYGDWDEANTILYEDRTDLDMKHLFWRNTDDHTHSGQQPTRYLMLKLGTKDSVLLPDLNSVAAADYYNDDYQTPATFDFTKGSYNGFDAGELAYEMNANAESNTTFTMNVNGITRHNPVFKIYGYTDSKPPTVKLDGTRVNNYNIDLNTVTDTLILQYLGDITSDVEFDIIDPEPTPPAVTVTGAPATWQNTDATATLDCVDDETGCDLDTYRLKTYTSEPGSCPTTYSQYTLTNPQTISSYAWVCGTAKDTEGTPGFSLPTEFKIDKNAPTGTITINSGSEYTSTQTVTLTLSCTDSMSGCSKMQFSNDGTSYSTLESYATTKSWNLTTGDGMKTVYVRYKDNAGHWMTTPATDTIYLDMTSPSTGVSGAPTGWQNTDASATTTCSDGSGSGCSSSTYRLKTYTSNPGSCPTSYSSYTLTSPQTISSHQWVCAAAKDNAGNPGYSSGPIEFRVDKIKPTTTDNAPSGWQNTDVTVTLTPTDTGGSGLADTFYCVDQANTCTPTSSGTSVLVSTEGTNYVRYYSVDVAGNSESVKSATVKIDKTRPTIAITSPENTTYSTDSVDLNYTVNDTDEVDWVGYSLDGGENVSVSPDGKVTRFSDSAGGDWGTATNIIFDQAESNTSVYLKVPKNSTIINATMNVSGYPRWQSDSGIASGLGDVGLSSAPSVFQKDSTWYLISGEFNGVFNGFNWTGSTWQSDSAIASGLGDMGGWSTPSVFQKDSMWYLISGEYDGVFNGFSWTGSTWQSDSAIASGLGTVARGSNPSVFQKDSTWYLISGNAFGIFYGFNWTGSTWQSDSAIASGLGGMGGWPNPSVFQKDSTWYLISGEYDGVFNGFNWTGSTWQSDSAIALGLGTVGLSSAPSVFQKDSTWYLISGEYDGVFNGYQLYFPTNPSIDVANDSIIDWSVIGELNSTNSPQTVDLNITAINDYLDTCSGDEEGNCLIPLDISSDTAGIVRLDALSIEYDIILKNLSNGQHSITVYANDTLGNMGYSTVSFTISTALPSLNITIHSPPNATITDTTPDLNLTTTEPSNISYTWDGEGNISGCSNCTTYITTYGEYANSSEQNLSLALHLNENTSTAVNDDSGNGNDGTLTGPIWAPGRFSSGLDFEEDEYLTIPHSDSLTFNDSFSISFWVTFKEDDRGQWIISKLDGTASWAGFHVDRPSNNKLRFMVHNATDTYSNLVYPVSNNTLYHVVLIRDKTASKLRLYLNGTSVKNTTSSITGLNVNTSKQVVIGAKYNFGNKLNATLDEILIFNRALGDTEISKLFNKTLSEGQNSVTVYAKDKSGNQNSTTRWFSISNP